MARDHPIIKVMACWSVCAPQSSHARLREGKGVFSRQTTCKVGLLGFKKKSKTKGNMPCRPTVEAMAVRIM